MGSLSTGQYRGFLSRGFQFREVSVQGGLCPEGLCTEGLCPGRSVSRTVFVQREISVQRGLYH